MYGYWLKDSGSEAQTASGLIKRLLILACCFVAAIIIAGSASIVVDKFFEANSRSYLLAMSVVQNLIGFIGTAYACAYFISKRPAGFLGLTEKVDLRPFLGVVIVYIIGIPFLNQIIYYNQQISLPASMSGLEHQMRQMESAAEAVTEIILASTSVGGLISGILIIGILTGLSEELLFRGALQKSLSACPAMGKWSIWIAAIIFSAVHMQFFGFIPRLLLGAFFGYLLYTTNSIWPGVFAHSLNNSMVILSTWISNKMGETGASADEWGIAKEGIPWIALISLFFLILFFSRYYNYFFNHGKKG